MGEDQHSYRKGTSTTTALIQIIDTATQIFDDNKTTGFAILSLDFSQAFDKVDHQILLDRLIRSQLPRGFVIWIQSYLSERSYQVRTQGQLSKVHHIREGVPQGSVLGPILFATLVGDLCSAKTNASHTLVQYADDANLIIPLYSNDLHTINEIILKQLTKIKEWCSVHKQELNTEKTKILISTRSKEAPCLDKTLHTTNTMKILGIHLNDKLKWDEHIHSICKKFAQRLYLLRIIKSHVDVNELHNIYTAVVRAQADYCCQLFVKLNCKLSKRLERLERRAHHVIFGESIENKCSCNLDGFRRRRELLSMKLMSKIIEDVDHPLHKRMPPRLSHKNRLSNFMCRTSTRQNTFIPYTTLLINQSQSQSHLVG